MGTQYTCGPYYETWTDACMRSGVRFRGGSVGIGYRVSICDMMMRKEKALSAPTSGFSAQPGVCVDLRPCW